MKVKTANACYTGGSIYVFYGELENGNYFMFDSFYEFIEVFDTEIDLEESFYSEWMDEHRVTTLTGEEAFKLCEAALNWIISNRPDGNYSVEDIEEYKPTYEEFTGEN